MIVLVTGWFKVYDRHGIPTGEKEFGTSHGVDINTGKQVITSTEHPQMLGATFDQEMMEWVITDD
jgi:hypothetical protein